MISFSNDNSGFLKKFKIKGPLVQGFWKISKINSNFGFKFFWKEPNWFYGKTVKEPKLWGLGFFTNSFGFLRFIVMNENQSSDFLKFFNHGSIISKIVNHGSIIPKPYLLVLSSKKISKTVRMAVWNCDVFKISCSSTGKVWFYGSGREYPTTLGTPKGNFIPTSSVLWGLLLAICLDHHFFFVQLP